jgi:hypothetical protein
MYYTYGKYFNHVLGFVFVENFKNFQPAKNSDAFMKAKYFYRVKNFGAECSLEKRGINLGTNVPS